MDKFKSGMDKKMKPPHPHLASKEALVKGSFAAREREDFFNDAYADIMSDYFVKWCSTSHHETQTREFLHSCVLALGDVKQRLMEYETRGKNEALMDKRDQ